MVRRLKKPKINNKTFWRDCYLASHVAGIGLMLMGGFYLIDQNREGDGILFIAAIILYLRACCLAKPVKD